MTSMLNSAVFGSSFGSAPEHPDSSSPDRTAPVPDPYYGGADGFDQVFDICEAGCRGLLAEVRTRLEAAS